MAINNEKPEMENEEMTETRTNIDDFLTVRGFGGYGAGYGFGGGQGMYPGNSVLAAEAHANGTATKEAIDNHAAQFTAGLTRVSDQNEETRRLNAFDNIKDGQFQAELRNSDRLRDVERLVISGQKEAAQCCCDTKIEMLKCCCETQKLVTAEAAATRELINQNTIRAAVDQNNINATVGGINAAAAANTAAIIAAIQNSGHHPHHP